MYVFFVFLCVFASVRSSPYFVTLHSSAFQTICVA